MSTAFIYLLGGVLSLSPTQTSAREFHSMQPAVPTTACDATETIEQRGGYGCHALEWRSAKTGRPVDTSVNMCWGVNEVFSDFPGPLEACLDGNDQLGGDWHGAFAFSPNELLAGTAMAMARWSSPVYTGLWIDNAARGVAIEKLTGPYRNPLDPSLYSSCSWLGIDSLLDVDLVDFKCALFEFDHIGVVSVDVVYWDATGRRARTLSVSEFNEAFVEFLRHFEPKTQQLVKIPYLYTRS